jgi:hypothetical protein
MLNSTLFYEEEMVYRLKHVSVVSTTDLTQHSGKLRCQYLKLQTSVKKCVIKATPKTLREYPRQLSCLR